MSSEQNNFYNKRLKSFAHEKRYEMTKAEACLWKFVLSSKKTGYTFNRQRPVLNFIADFMCKELKLIIEIDGYSHFLDEVITKDNKKQKALEELGFTVIRFTDSEVLNQIEIVRIAIMNFVEQIENKNVLPYPLQRGTFKTIRKNLKALWLRCRSFCCILFIFLISYTISNSGTNSATNNST